MLFDATQVFLPQQLRVFRRDKAALAGKRIYEALGLQLVIGALCRDDADAQILGETAYRGQRLILPQRVADYLRLYLRIYLVVRATSL